MERDAKGRFIKGVGGNPGTRFDGGVAVEMQERSVAARKEHRTVAEVLRAQLAEKAAEGQSMTRLEYLTLKAINTHAKGDMTMRDLREMQKVLGEDVKEMNINAGDGGSITITLASPKAVAGLQRAIENGAQPAAPEDE